MNVAAAILIAIFAGAFLVVIVGALAALIVLHLRMRKSQKETLAAFTEFTTGLDSALAKQRSDTAAIIDGARNSFTGIRQEIKTSQEAQANALARTLKDHEQAFRETMGKINATALEAASVRGLQAANRIVQVAQTLQAMLIEGAAPPTGTDLAPEEAAPNDTIYAMQGYTARLDEAAEQFASEELTPQFSGGGEG
jgi:predicted membrane metal-binding protein